ncbi:hypothetical protein Tsubulata_005769 [Turnera subulata]|uniref:C2 domain-containing protein n=1 Tax=Turnera subulata TaxID=218843 RepID=A0A9Q0F7F3_9ROSI|nr:hypothetical protein Tsubulata_005769 [Turnera subulata]
MASSKSLDLEITIISAKHLKNVNWSNGDLKPYATFHLDSSDHRLATHADDSGSTSPVWNERFTLPVTRPVRESLLSLDIFHSKPSETPKPLVGSAKFPLAQILDSDSPVYTIHLLRPSGRPQGKVRVKLQLKERPLPSPSPSPSVQDYHSAPSYTPYYNPHPPPPPPPAARDYRDFSPSPYYSDPYNYYSNYYPPQPSLLSRPPYTRAPSNYVIPSAPVDAPPEYKPSAPGCWQREPSYPGLAAEDGRASHPKVGGGAPELSSAIGGLTLDEGASNYEKEKVAADRESHSYREYRREY